MESRRVDGEKEVEGGRAKLVKLRALDHSPSQAHHDEQGLGFKILEMTLQIQVDYRCLIWNLQYCNFTLPISLKIL